MQQHQDLPISRKFSIFGPAMFLPGICNVVNTYFEFKGSLDLDLFERVVEQITRRHVVLRSRLLERDGGFIYVPSDDVAGAAFTRADVSLLPEPDRNREILLRLQAAIWSPFDVAADPAVRAVTIKADADRYVIGIVINHCYSDQVSLQNFCSELRFLYDSYANGKFGKLPELPLQYNDYLRQIERWLDGETGRTSLEYFRSRLVPLCTPQVGVKTDAGGARISATATLPAELTTELQKYCLNQQVTMFCLLLSINFLVLSEFSEQRELCVIAQDSGRRTPEQQALIAPMLGYIPCCVRVDMPFADLLRTVRKEWSASYRYGQLPFDRLLPFLGQGDKGRSFPMVNFMAGPSSVRAAAGPPGSRPTDAPAGLEMKKADETMANALRSRRWTPSPGIHKTPQYAYEPLFGLRIGGGPQISLMMHSANSKCSSDTLGPYLERFRTAGEEIVGGALG